MNALKVLGLALENNRHSCCRT